MEVVIRRIKGSISKPFTAMDAVTILMEEPPPCLAQTWIHLNSVSGKETSDAIDVLEVYLQALHSYGGEDNL